MVNVAGREQELLGEVADQYRSKGYRVLVEPEPEALPEFLRLFRPDLVAESEHENVVVEVKLRGSRDPELRGLAEELRKHPGWRLQVLMAGSDDLGSEQEDQPLSLREIGRSLESVNVLYETGHEAAAFLLLWSLLEAAVKNQLKDLGVFRRSPQVPSALAKDLVAHGLASEAEYKEIISWAVIRNAVAHGNPTRAIPEAAFSRLRDLVRRLIADSPGQ